MVSSEQNLNTCTEKDLKLHAEEEKKKDEIVSYDMNVYSVVSANHNAEGEGGRKSE